MEPRVNRVGQDGAAGLDLLEAGGHRDNQDGAGGQVQAELAVNRALVELLEPRAGADGLGGVARRVLRDSLVFLAGQECQGGAVSQESLVSQVQAALADGLDGADWKEPLDSRGNLD